MSRFLAAVLKDNLLGCPFVSDRKCNPLAAPLIAAGGSFLSGLVGGLFGSSSQSSANETNLEIARMNNEVQKQLAREANQQSQQQFIANMNWLREQYYDTDKVRRDVEAYKAAGLNPYALAGNSATTVGSVGTPGMSDFKVANTEAGHVDPFFLDTHDFSQGISSAVDAYFQNQLVNAQSENLSADSQQKQIDNMTRWMENISRIRLTLAEGDKMLSDKNVSDETKKSIELQNKYLRKQIKVYTKQMSALAAQPQKNNELMDAQMDQLQSQAAVNRMQLDAVRANIRLTESQIDAIYAEIKQKWQMVKNDTRLANASEREKAQSVIHMLNQDAAAFEQIGIDKELVGSQKFRNYISGVVEGIVGSAGLLFGGRSIFAKLKR